MDRDVLKAICTQNRYKDIPKVILTISSSKMHVDECLSNGATAYIVKPNSMTALEALAEKLLSFCRNGDQRYDGR